MYNGGGFYFADAGDLTHSVQSHARVMAGLENKEVGTPPAVLQLTGTGAALVDDNQEPVLLERGYVQGVLRREPA